MTTQYICGEELRRQAVLANGVINGIDFLEVATTDQLTLRLGFFLAVNGLTPDNFRIEGGVRVTGIRVEMIVGQPGTVITLAVDNRGDFSNYILRLVSGPDTDAPPAGFDPQLSAIEFSFKVACPNDFDCKTTHECPPVALEEPEIDYLAKDYGSFRRLMLDRLSVLMPDWRERNPADTQITLVELLAYVGDHLSYAQDAAATEVYLGTARRRVSLRRHARLLDYRISEGCNARCFVALTVTSQANGMVLKGAHPDLNQAGTQFVTRLTDAPPQLDKLPPGAEREAIIFESLHDVMLMEPHNEISFYTWSDSSCCLPKGATRGTLRNKNAALALEPGDLLLFEEVTSPRTGLAVDADSSHRHVVRLESVDLAAVDPLDGTALAEITWSREDALPFPLCLSARVTLDGVADVLKETAVARGNIVLTDHGQTVASENLIPPAAPRVGEYRPLLPRRDLTFAAPYNLEVVVRDEVTNDIESVEPAANALNFHPREASPALWLSSEGNRWSPEGDLLGSDRFELDFVVEMERDGIARLRFGDNQLGRRPEPDAPFNLSFRVGTGAAGNIGADALCHVVVDQVLLPPGRVTRIRNPLAARGGTAPEDFEQVRQFAPQAFRTQQRAVTEGDWAEVAQRFPSVQRAVARFRWTGSWHTVFVTVDRVGGLTAARDPRFKTALRDHLERFRIAGYDLQITDPIFVPLKLSMLVCVLPGYFRSNVLAGLQRIFSRQALPDGTLGFFHPDNFTFGQSLYLSKVCATALKVAGVASVQLKEFHRFGFPSNHELANGLIPAAALEILRLDNDPSFPENGKLEFDLRGGL